MWKGAVTMVIVGVVLVWLQYPRAVSRQEYLDHIKDKVVVVCGASSGIGEQLAYKLGEQGAQVMLVARTQSKLEKVKEGAIAAGAKRVEMFPYDFSNVEESGSVIDKAMELFGRIDYLVLNHASLANSFLIDNRKYQQPEFISRMFKINVQSFFELTFKALPHLEKSGGHIFVTSSIAGEFPGGFYALYSSTKHALNGFFYSLQQELLARKSNVGITIGALGAILTDDIKAVIDLVDSSSIPEFAKGDVGECAQGMMNSLVLRPRTFTYPVVATLIGRLTWYFNPYAQEQFVAALPFEKANAYYAAYHARSKETGFQKGNI